MFSAERTNPQNLTQNLFSMVVKRLWVREYDCVCSMELSDILDSEALEYCSQMADHITPEQDSDDSLDELMLTTCHWEPPTTTEVADQEYEAAEPATTAEPDTDSTPTMRACTRRAGNQPHPSRAPASRFATPVTDDEVL